MRLLYQTDFGKYFLGDVIETLDSPKMREYYCEVDLILTSPPFPLVKKKEYGNYNGQEYIDWMVEVVHKSMKYLKENGSIVIEIGNAWEPLIPAISTIPMETMLAIKKETGMYLCQEIIVHNPGRLPSPVQWVNNERTRLKDSWTRVWWFSKTPNPKARNIKVLIEYSDEMKRIIQKQFYYSGTRPSGHKIGDKSFLKDNGGSISPSFLDFSKKYLFNQGVNSSLSLPNTGLNREYSEHCKSHDIKPHPARMQQSLVDFFVHFLTDENDLVMDVFGGSNTTGWRSEVHRRRWLAIEKDWEYGVGSIGRFEKLRKGFSLKRYG